MESDPDGKTSPKRAVHRPLLLSGMPVTLNDDLSHRSNFRISDGSNILANAWNVAEIMPSLIPSSLSIVTSPLLTKPSKIRSTIVGRDSERIGFAFLIFLYVS